MKKLIVFLVIALSLSGCGLFKTVTVTKVETVIQVDTVIKVQLEHDTIIVEKPITDTAIIISHTGTSISYVDPIINKIVLQFLPKTFDVPIIINSKKTETIKIKEPMFKIGLKLMLLAVCFVLLMFGFLLWRINKLLKLKP